MFRNNILLSKYTSYKIGGRAKYFCEPKTVEQIVKAVTKAKQKKLPIFILGGGTNLLIDDKGFDGLVLKPNLTWIQTNSPNVTIGAGVDMADLLEFTIDDSLSGLEWAGGLPGTFGGAIRGNAGAFSGEIKDIVKEVVSLDISGRETKVVKRNNKECKFSYRSSIFKERDGKEIILSATLALKKGDKRKIKKAIQEKIAYRKERHPMDYPNIGSIFKNVDVRKISGDMRRKFKSVIKTDPFPVVPTAYLISEVGLKGVGYGGAMVSPRHPNFIVNVSGASSEDVKKVAQLVQETVREKFGINLEREVIYL